MTLCCLLLCSFTASARCQLQLATASTGRNPQGTRFQQLFLFQHQLIQVGIQQSVGIKVGIQL